jgi:hypothetical protein
VIRCEQYCSSLLEVLRGSTLYPSHNRANKGGRRQRKCGPPSKAIMAEACHFDPSVFFLFRDMSGPTFGIYLFTSLFVYLSFI